MAESWKGPTALIGILTVLTTFGIFVYQEWKDASKSSDQELNKQKEPVEAPRPPTITYRIYQEKIGKWEAKLDSIDKKIIVYEDSFKLMSKWISKTEIFMEVKKDFLNSPNLPDSVRNRHQDELDSLRRELIFENADTYRYQINKFELNNLKIKVMDSLRIFKEFHKMNDH